MKYLSIALLFAVLGFAGTLAWSQEAPQPPAASAEQRDLPAGANAEHGRRAPSRLERIPMPAPAHPSSTPLPHVWPRSMPEVLCACQPMPNKA